MVESREKRGEKKTKERERREAREKEKGGRRGKGTKNKTYNQKTGPQLQGTDTWSRALVLLFNIDGKVLKIQLHSSGNQHSWKHYFTRSV